MEIRVVDADGKTFFAYPKLFLNDRTRQLMVNPHIETIGARLADLYISPIEFDPGKPAGAFETVELKKGEAKSVGEAVSASSTSTSRPRATRWRRWRAASR